MKKGTAVWLITAGALILVGAMIFAGGMTALNWNFMKLSTTKLVTNEHVPKEEFVGISISGGTADVSILPSEDGETRIVSTEYENAPYAVEVKDGVLSVELRDARKWYEYIGINFESPSVTVYLPKGEYGAFSVALNTGDLTVSEGYLFEAVAISATTGDIDVRSSAKGEMTVSVNTGDVSVGSASMESLSLAVSTGTVRVKDVTVAGKVSLKVSTGKARLETLRCGSFSSTGDTGDLTLVDVIADGMISVERSTGNVGLERCDAAELSVLTDTGDVRGTLLSEKVFIVNTDTGRKDVPESTEGGKCKITTDTGDVVFRIEK